MSGIFHYTAMPYARIAQTLATVTSEGQHHRGSGWSDWGDLVYEPPVAGWVIKSRQAEPGNGTRYRVYVDYAGKGRKQALPRYAAALQAAGFGVHEALLSEYGKKTVLWVDWLPEDVVEEGTVCRSHTEDLLCD